VTASSVGELFIKTGETSRRRLVMRSTRADFFGLVRPAVRVLLQNRGGRREAPGGGTGQFQAAAGKSSAADGVQTLCEANRRS